MGKIQSYTYDDYAKLSDGRRYELIEGGLVEMAPAPTPGHQGASWNLSHALASALDRAWAGRAFAAPIDVILDPENTFQPDLVFIAAARESIITKRGIEGAPDLVIEILSPSSEPLDRGKKMRLYYEHEVREYWLVDPDAKRVEVYLPGSDAFDLHATLSGDDLLTTSLLPGFAVETARIFRA